jgi:hypothetical protein
MLLEINEEALELAQEFLSQTNLPKKAANDALHREATRATLVAFNLSTLTQIL